MKNTLNLLDLVAVAVIVARIRSVRDMKRGDMIDAGTP